MAASWDALLALERSSGTPAPGEAMTLEEWAALPEDEPGEWVDGRLTEEEEPDSVHEATVAWLIGLIDRWLGDDGFVLGAICGRSSVPRRGESRI